MKLKNKLHKSITMHVAGYNLEVDKEGCVELSSDLSKNVDVLNKLELAGFKKCEFESKKSDKSDKSDKDKNSHKSEEKPKFLRKSK